MTLVLFQLPVAVSARINRTSGYLCGLACGGLELLAAPLEANFWRPGTDNDYGCNFQNDMACWRDAGKQARLLGEPQIVPGPEATKIDVLLAIGSGGAQLAISYEVSATAGIIIRAQWRPGSVDAFKESPPPYRIGFKGLLNDGFENVEWFGRGPHESYIDRHVSARIGRFQGSILNQTFKYVRPQENGNKFETRWMALLRSSAGTGAESCAGLALAARPPTGSLDMQCHRYLLDDFDAGKDKVPRHAGELVERAQTAFYIDVAHMGLGGIDSWGAKPLPQHMINPSQDYNWAFQLRPLQAGDL